MKRQLSKPQIICIVLLWALLCFLVLTRAENLDGTSIASLLIGSALVFIPVWKSMRQR